MIVPEYTDPRQAFTVWDAEMLTALFIENCLGAVQFVNSGTLFRRASRMCLTWVGDVDGEGYAVLSDGGKRVALAAAELAFWAIPSGHHVVMRCGTRACANPDHITVVQDKALGRPAGAQESAKHTRKPMWSADILRLAPTSECPGCGAVRHSASTIIGVSGGNWAWSYSCPACRSLRTRATAYGDAPRTLKSGRWTVKVSNGAAIVAIEASLSNGRELYGCSPQVADSAEDAVINDWIHGHITAREAASRLGVGRSTAYARRSQYLNR